MAKYPFSEKELRAAIRIFNEKQESALEAALDHDPVFFSDTFREKMDSLMQTGAAAKKRHKVRSGIAAAIAVVILLLASFLFFDTSARAGFVNWIKNVYSSITNYLFFGENDEEELPAYAPGWIPDGLRKEEEKTEENHYSLLFLNDEQDRGFIFICQK